MANSTVSPWAKNAEKRRRTAGISVSQLARDAKVPRSTLTTALNGLNEDQVEAINAVLAGAEVDD